jgi:hypothetical protein
MQARKVAKPDLRPFQFSLRIRHPSIDPAALTREFGVEPEHSYRAGDQRALRSIAAQSTVHTESYWLGSLDPFDWPQDLSYPGQATLQVALEQLRQTATDSFGWALSLSAGRFLRTHADLLRRIAAEGGQVTLLVALSASEVGSFTLMPEVSRILGDLGVAVEFEFVDA